ncbi:type 4a pilus biogenesis protein PilO [Oceanospirillum beijerinckii]|uniref:type 4a pilus biogenesis protein PilO n=1 Tax=Oceanospirillum beijerinckii TaxID=64976 RepID=UPI000415B297|nr:type 4a pilus biogenesis protein PilO [Oceanospirillum beijerinckii]
MKSLQRDSQLWDKLKNKIVNIDLAEIDFKNAGSWPRPGRFLTLITIFTLTLILGYQLYIKPLEHQYQQTKALEKQLIQAYEIKALQGANLIAYRQQMSEIQQLIKTLSSQLPDDNAIPELIEQIGELAQNNRVEIQSLKLQPIKDNKIYLAQPIDLEISGSFHNLSLFVASITGLQRIVTLHDFSLKPDTKLLNLRIQAMTYHNKKTVQTGNNGSDFGDKNHSADKKD